MAVRTFDSSFFDCFFRVRFFLIDSLSSLHRNKVNAVEHTKNITLHAKNLNISTDAITIKQLGQNTTVDKKIAIDRTEFISEYDLFIIHTKDALAKGNQYELVIPFRGELGIGLYGYYRSSYTDQKSKTKR